MKHLFATILAFCLCFSIHLPDLCAQQDGFHSSTSDSRGVFVFYRYQYSDPWGHLLDNPNVAGGRQQLYWAEVNPDSGVYTWDAIDEALSIAHNQGKKAALAVTFAGYGGWQDPYAANGVPDWVYAKGEGESVDYLEWHEPYTRYPVFWSSTIKTYFQIFVKAFGERYNGNEDLEYVIIGLYPEMNLGKDANSLTQEWLEAGYTDDLYENTVKWYIDLYAQNFSNTQLSLACFSSKPIKLMSNARFDVLRNNIAAYLNDLPNGGIENNALRDASSWGFIQQWFRFYYPSTHILYEAVDKSSGGGRAGDFRAKIENGLTAHADHFQIYYEDIVVATTEQPGYDPAYEEALAFAAENIGLEPGDEEREYVWLRFNAADNETGSGKFYFQGIYCDANAPFGEGMWPEGNPRPTDGDYVPMHDTGEPGRECVRTSETTGDSYIYLDIDNDFISGSSSVSIEVQYLDTGIDELYLEYDGESNMYTQTDAIHKTNTGLWTAAEFVIDDGVFNNRQSEGNDFRICSGGDGDEYINFVKVTKREEVNSHRKGGTYSLTTEIYPNPSTGIVYITQQDILGIEVYDLSGRRINANIRYPIIDIRNTLNGIYFLKLRTLAGVRSARIVKI